MRALEIEEAREYYATAATNAVYNQRNSSPLMQIQKDESQFYDCDDMPGLNSKAPLMKVWSKQIDDDLLAFSGSNRNSDQMIHIKLRPTACFGATHSANNSEYHKGNSSGSNGGTISY